MSSLDSNKMIKLLIYGAIGGFVGGVVYSLVMIYGGMFPMIGGMMGFAAPLDFLMGVVLHFMASIIFGIAYGVLLILILNFLETWDMGDIVKSLILGVIFGFAVWIFGPIMVMPMMMGMPVPNIPNLLDPSLVPLAGFAGHLIFGAIIAVVVLLIYQRFES